MKKICFVSTKAEKLFRPESKISFGGSEVQQFFLAHELAKYYQVSFILAGDKKVEDPLIKVIPAFKIKTGLIAKIRAAFNLYRSLKTIDPDIVIQRAHGLETLICAIYARLNKKNFVYAIASQADIDGTWTRGFAGQLFKLGIEGADLLVSQNKTMTKLAQQRGLPKRGSILEIPKGLPIKTLRTSKETILWIGRCIKMKRPQAFIDLAQANPKSRFVMVCPPGPDSEFNQNIENNAATVTNLIFKTYVDPKNIPALHAQAKAFVLTSLWEGDLPMVVLESLTQRNPILTLSYDPGIIVTNQIGFCADNSTSNLDKMLKKILRNRQPLSDNAFAFVRDRYSISKVGQQWYRALESLK